MQRISRNHGQHFFPRCILAIYPRRLGRFVLAMVGLKGRCRNFPRIPGYALHEKRLQRQISIGKFVSSQEQRALFVPWINRLPIAGQLRALFFHRFTQDLFCPRFRKEVQDNCPRCPGRQDGRLFPWRADPSASRPALPGPTPPPCRASPRPDLPVVYPGCGFDNLHVSQGFSRNIYSRFQGTPELFSDNIILHMPCMKRVRIDK